MATSKLLGLGHTDSTSFNIVLRMFDRNQTLFNAIQHILRNYFTSFNRVSKCVKCCEIQQQRTVKREHVADEYHI